MKRRTALIALASATVGALLAGCVGIPILSIPKLMGLQQELLEIDPAGFRLAVQADARLAPPAGATPWMVVKIQPARAGAFEPINQRLAMSYENPGATPVGLKPAPSGRRWLVYGLTPQAQAQLREIQARIKAMREQKGSSGGGSVSLGIEQAGLAPQDAAWQGSRWETWLQTKAVEGYFEMWSGTVEQLKRQ